MQIKKVRIQNFYSFKEAEVDYTKYKGIVQILGKNKDSGGSNGSGKSSIIEAVSWGVFGKTIRKSTEDALVNSIAGSNCFVEIELEQQGIGSIVIKRSKRPTSLILTVNGVVSNKENAVETQKYIEELIESDHKSFMAATIFGQHADCNFLDSSPDEKRNIIKNCFNLEEFFSKRESIKELKSSYIGELKALTSVHSSLKNDRSQLEVLVPDKKYKYIELPSLEEILKVEKRIVDLKSKLSNGKAELEKLKATQLKIDTALEKGIFTEESDCPVCKAKYSKSQCQNDIEDLSCRSIVGKGLISSKADELNTIILELDSLKPKYSSSEWAKYNEKNKLVQEAQKVIDKLQNVVESIKAHEISINELNRLIEIMKFWELAFSEKGMIRYIIRNILEYFNLRSNEYLSILTNNQFSIIFNDELSEEVFNNGRSIHYISLSGGEKRKVNLAIMLALQDLQNRISRTQSNLIFFDEVCDNIDDLGIEAIHNLLNTLKNQHLDKVILLITHNDKLSGLFGESQNIKVVKQKGISRLE